MRKTALPTTTYLSAILAGLFILELYSALESPDYLTSPHSEIALQASGVQTADSGSSSQSALSAWRSLVLARPLFDPSRRPPAALFQAAAPPMKVPRLSGIMITATEKMAVFSPDTGAPIIVSENSRFGAFTVLSIARDSVTLKGPSGLIVVRSNFSYQEPSGKSTLDKAVLPGGIDLDLIKVPLPSAATWPGPPPLQ